MDKTKLLSYQPNYYLTSDVMCNIDNANATELTLINNALTDVYNELYIDTATTSLDRWEKEYGLTIANNYDVGYRRSRINSKKKGFGNITLEQMKDIIGSFANGTVDIIEDNPNYTFTVKFIDITGVPPNIDDLTEIVEVLKPAHLVCVFQYTYETWGEVNNFTWGDVAESTWGDVLNKPIQTNITKLYSLSNDGNYNEMEFKE